MSQEVDKKQQVTAIKHENSLESKPCLEWKYKFNEKTGEDEFDSIQLSDGSKIDEQNLKEALKRASGTSDPKTGERILRNVAHGMSAKYHKARINEVSGMLPALKPSDETEALLLGQFLALQDSAMGCLRNANSQPMFYRVDKLFGLAAKLFNTANQTMQTLLKYRSGGQQVVQVVHLHNEGQAIVAQNLSPPSSGEGAKRKFEN